ncbi:MAG TPA: CoA-binding protein [Gemmatimonadales bacterium]|nr:CoA-binding protein [Gemmatimonadales bacterium]
MTHVNPANEELRALLASARTIAMVGASSNPDRPSHGVMKFLLHRGFHVVPVTPFETEVHGQKAYASLAEIPEPVDIVDVFRRADATPPIADEAVAIGAKALWLQLGIASEEAARRAGAGGLTVIMNRCIAETTRELGIEKSAV